MAGTAYDGHPEQAGASGGVLTGQFPQFSIAGMTEGVIVDRYYVDASGNRGGNCVVYDVRDIHTGQIIPKARALQPSFGLVNGQEHVFHPASKPINGTATFDKHTRATDTDGDIVLIAFIGGSRHNPVIMGALPHNDVPYAAKIEDGERKFLTHQGTSVEIDKEGAVELIKPVPGVSATRFSISADGNVEIVGFSSKTIKISFAGGGSIQIGSAPTDPAILGNQHRATFDELVANVNELWTLFAAHVHDVGAPSSSSAGISPTPSPPTSSVPVVPNIATPMPDTDLSKVVVLQ